ncbi:MAG: acyl-CoA dehydrogenase, partial [Pseudomonadota bacterium]
GRLAAGEVAATRRAGDLQGARLENGVVRTSPGFKEAYGKIAEGGWVGMTADPDFGGMGLPIAFQAALNEMLAGANMALSLCPILSQGAIETLQHYGTPEQKAVYLPKLTAGVWNGTMNLTEPQAGSDLSGVRTKAEPVGDGRYKISGQKIYITYGDHDLADNVVHLVLARLPDAPEGTGGISMFIVPKFHVNEDGSLGARNDVDCVGLEHKMGLHGSPTAVMAYGERGECYGTLLGEENKGLRNMFVMMNSARLDVGAQGVGVAERAFQHALAYAQDRKQGRAPGVRDGDMIPIYEHPDVRRTLYLMKAMVEASRGICYANAVAFDLSKMAKDDDTRQAMKAREALLTPIAKAWSTDRANEVTSMGVQIHGGMGYVEETGAAQFMRDARIAAIYEGTNGIQAMDLVGRKLQGDGGAAMRALIAEMRANAGEVNAMVDQPMLQNVATKFNNALQALEFSTDWILKRAKDNAEDPLAGATPYLKQVGNVLGAHVLALGVRGLMAEGADEALVKSKQVLLKVYADQFLAEAVGLTATVLGGAASVEKLDASLLAG